MVVSRMRLVCTVHGEDVCRGAAVGLVYGLSSHVATLTLFFFFQVIQKYSHNANTKRSVKIQFSLKSLRKEEV